MPESQLVPLPDEAVTQWAASRSTPLPQGAPGERLEHLEIHVDGVPVGGVVLGHSGEGQGSRLAIRLLETTLADDDHTHWPAVLDAIERRAEEVGAASVVTTVPPSAAPTFQACGFEVTMTGLAFDMPAARITVPSDRVVLRPMHSDERPAFVSEAREFLRSGMAEAGVLADDAEPMTAVERRLAALVDDPPSEELLLTIAADATAVGHFWFTEVSTSGQREVVANTVYLGPEHRGAGLMGEVYSAVDTYLRDLDVRRVHGRLYRHHEHALDTLRAFGMTIDSIHLRKDLSHPPG